MQMYAYLVLVGKSPNISHICNVIALIYITKLPNVIGDVSRITTHFEYCRRAYYIESGLMHSIYQNALGVMTLYISSLTRFMFIAYIWNMRLVMIRYVMDIKTNVAQNKGTVDENTAKYSILIYANRGTLQSI